MRRLLRFPARWEVLCFGPFVAGCVATYGLLLLIPAAPGPEPEPETIRRHSSMDRRGLPYEFIVGGVIDGSGLDYPGGDRPEPPLAPIEGTIPSRVEGPR